MTEETVIDGAPGETRRVVFAGGRAIEIDILRWFDGRPRLGALFVGRVTAADRALRGAFLDLGSGREPGFIRLERRRDGPPVSEGRTLLARVVREPSRGKSAVLEAIEERAGAALGPAGDPDAELRCACPASAEVRARIDAAIEEALAPIAPVTGGGRLLIEPTAALVAIDVDAAGRKQSGDPEAFARALNVEAAGETARQLRLRGLGGLAAIDFVAMREAASERAVLAALREAMSGDPWGATVGGFSRFGVVELSRGQRRTPLHELLLDDRRDPTPATTALNGLRALESAAAAEPSRTLRLILEARAHSWLREHGAAAMDALRARIGGLWTLEPVGERAQRTPRGFDVERD